MSEAVQQQSDMADVLTYVHAIDANLTALRALLIARSLPAEISQQSYDDTMRIYGITAQTGEVVSNERDQIQALADVINMMLGRVLEHDRRAIHTAAAIDGLLLLVQAMAPADVALAAADARALILTERQAQLAELAAHEQMQRDLLKIARMDEREYLGTAAADAREVVTEAAQQARHDLASEQRIEAARDVNAE